MPCGGHTAGKHIISWELYIVPIWSELSVSERPSISNLTSDWPSAAQHFIVAGCLAGISSIYLFIYYCLLRILATKGFWFCVSCLCSQRGFENYILFEDKLAGISHCLLYLASRCHLTKIGSRHSCVPHTEERRCFTAKPNHYSACAYQHIYRSGEKGEGFLPNQHLRSPKY